MRLKIRFLLITVALGLVFFGGNQSVFAVCSGVTKCGIPDQYLNCPGSAYETFPCDAVGSACYPTGCGGGAGCDKGDTCNVSGGGGGSGCACGVRADGACRSCNTSCTNANYNIDCPAGMVKTTTLLSAACERIAAYCAPGTAQTGGVCCDGYYEQNCRDVTQNGHTTTFCEDGAFVCTANILNTYTCAASCTATAPGVTALVSPANGAQQATSTVTLTWNSTTFGTACSEVS